MGGKSTTILKQGWIKKRGKINKTFKRRYFQLFTNKKLCYFDGNGANKAVKGYINLEKLNDCTKLPWNCEIRIQTDARCWILQFDSISKRDDWFNAMQTKGITMEQTANHFVNEFDAKTGVVDKESDSENESDEIAPIAMAQMVLDVPASPRTSKIDANAPIAFM